MIVHRLHSFNEYEDYRDRMGPVYEQRRAFEQRLQPADPKAFTVPGISYPAGQLVNLQANFAHSHGGEVNWREWLICPVTGLNNRLRAALHLIDSELGPLPWESLYITEQVTPLFAFLARKYPSIVGSEFLGDRIPRGQSDANGVRNENLTCLTFSDTSFDVVLSFDCFEHMPDFPQGMREIARVTKPGGRLLWSVPFRSDLPSNLTRAAMQHDGSITHYEQPEYHGDPVNAEGCLCFTHFGWEMLDQVKEAGFRRCYALAYWSDIFGYLGTQQFLFLAVK